MYLNQLSKCCRRNRRCKHNNFRLHDCHNFWYGYSGPQIILMMPDETSCTLNFMI
jgi:hypothetical protein